MNAGKLNRRALIERPVITQDPVYGAKSTTWVTVDEVWVEAQDVLPSRSEFVAQGMQQARSQTRIRMRWRNDITSAMRITLRGDVDQRMQIVGGPSESVQRKGFLELMCERYSSEGA